MNWPIRVAVVVALAWSTVAGAADGRGQDGQGCRGTMTGAVSAEFQCTVRLIDVDEATTVLEIRGVTSVEKVPSYAPGAFQLPKPVKPGRYTLEELGPGRASVAAEGGTLYTATKTTGKRGEVLVELTTVKVEPGGARSVHGTYRAKLIPAGSGKSGEVVVQVTF